MSEKRLGATCLCGEVSWRINAEPTPFAHCHCSVCRKAHGSAYATYMAANEVDLEWLSGESFVATYESSDGFHRRFCSQCGSVVPGIAADGHVFAPPGGALNDPGEVAKIHIFVDSMAPWHSITDALRQFPVFPKGHGPDSVTAAQYEINSEHPHGSCMCGAVAFEMIGPFSAARNCHCSRCRRARAATHAANAYAPIDSFRFVKGQSHVKLYKVPEARFFTQAFCDTCGSIVPRVYASRGVVTIPLGAFDGHPGITPQEHIFAGFKAEWHPITDSLPRHEAGPI